MPARKLIADFAHALDVFLDLEEEREIEPWDRKAPLHLDAYATGIWDDLPCADNPPKAYLLTSRQRDGETVYELLWVAGDDADSWPVVEVSASGEAQVVSASAEDWIATLLLTAGMLGGGSEDDLEDARDEASNEARALADDLANELDIVLPNPERMGERCEEAEEQFGDAWMDAVEGIED